jgi:hypothetical protein
VDPARSIELTANFYFGIASSVSLIVVCTVVTDRIVEPRLGRDMVSGSSRLITGFVQLVLLPFGLTAGAVLVGYRPENLVDAARESVAAPWALLAPWAGVVVVGVYLTFSAPRNSLWWMLLVLLLAFAAQQGGAGLFGKEISGFFGTLVATPLGYLIYKRLALEAEAGANPLAPTSVKTAAGAVHVLCNPGSRATRGENGPNRPGEPLAPSAAQVTRRPGAACRASPRCPSR